MPSVTSSDIPEIGTRVEITTDWSDRVMAIPYPTVDVTRGVVVASNTWDDPETMKIMRDHDLVIPGQRRDSVIYFKRILDIKVIGKEEICEEPSDKKTFQITGSKGDIYTVELTSGKWSCNCHAGNRGKTCRHVKEAMARD